MSDTDYRIHILDETGHILFSRAAAYRDDLDALQEAERECEAHRVELWQGSRLVARVKVRNAPLDTCDSTCL